MKYNACVNLSNFSATLLKLSSRDGVISWMFFHEHLSLYH
jgi:hypothetical protein